DAQVAAPSSDRSGCTQRGELLVAQSEVLHEHRLRVLAEARCAAPRLDLDGIAGDRTARIGNRAADFRVLDRAPVVALLVMRDVAVLFDGVHEAPRDAVGLRAVEAFLAVARGDETGDGVTHDGAGAIFRHAVRFV